MVWATFNGSDYAEAKVKQWDYGQQLGIQGLKLPTSVEIHFAVSGSSEDAKVRVGTTADGITTVPIPDSVLEQPKDIMAYIYLTDENSGKTVNTIRIKNSARPKPELHNTPEEAELFRAAIEAVNAAADRAEAAVSAEAISGIVIDYLKEHPVGDADPEKIAEAVVRYFEENPITAEGIGALPDTTEIPEKLSDLDEDTGHRTVTDTEKKEWNGKSNFSGSWNDLDDRPLNMPASDVYDWAKQPEKPTYIASEVGARPDNWTPTAQDVNADPSGTADNKVAEHNANTEAHNDIRMLIEGLASRLNALADSDDTTLDQMSEVVAYIKSNKSLIDAITTSKVSVSDIIDNLNTNVSSKPLSAAQGVALKALIDAITIPEKLPNPQKLTFAGAVTAEYDGSGAVTVTIPDGKTERIEKLSTDTTVTLDPGKLYIFPEMDELALTLAEPADTGIANEYHVIFQSGATATILSIPDTINVPAGFSVDANKIYELSIMEGCMLGQSWEVQAGA